jgi:hypothetical protein
MECLINLFIFKKNLTNNKIFSGYLNIINYSLHTHFTFIRLSSKSEGGPIRSAKRVLLLALNGQPLSPFDLRCFSEGELQYTCYHIGDPLPCWDKPISI